MNKKSVLIGISGGVDSAVAAHLLQNAGYHVEGLYLYNGFPTRSEEDAARVCDIIGIPLHTLDITASFRKDIVDYFISDYLAARTPNPCIVCNKRIKFTYLLNEADRHSLDFIATGHYARIENVGGSHGLRLRRGRDRKKDQTYFLYMLGQMELARLLFPNAELTKEEIKTIGAELGLGKLSDRESQEICFIPDNSYRKFIEETIFPSPFKPGNIVDREGSVVGTHRGIYSVTVGQRKGLNIASKRPYYVLALDKEKNEVIVGRDEDQYCNGLVADCVSWVSPDVRSQNPIPARTHIRYRHRGVESEIERVGIENENSGSGETVRVTFVTPQKAVAPGQAAVFYQNDILIGGGWIREGVRHG